MTISRTKIGNRIKRKSDSDIVDTILEAKKNKGWMEIAQIISGSTRKYPSVNLKDINKKSADGDTIVIPGKVIGAGELNKRIKICAVKFSSSALDKMKTSKSEAVTLVDEIRKNPRAQGIKVIK